MKIWFITGASSGLGAALVRAVIGSGDKVAATFRKADAAAAFQHKHAGTAIGIVMDVTDEGQIRKAVAATTQQLGPIDVLVNNAGYGTIGGIEEFSMEEIRAQMETNFFGAMAVTKAVLPAMRERGSGHIVQISSASGFRAMAGFGVYNASKFALEGFSEALAQEVAPFNIRVVIVEPGPFRTRFLAGSMKLPEHRLEAYKASPVSNMYTYMERMDGKQEGDPEKAGAAIVTYVHENKAALRLPLGKAAIQSIRSKIESVQKDLAENESIAASVVFNEIIR